MGSREELLLSDFASRAEDAVHSGAGELGVHEEEQRSPLALPRLDRLVRGDRPRCSVLLVSNPVNPPSVRLERGVPGEPLHGLGRQAANESHRPVARLAENALEGGGDEAPERAGGVTHGEAAGQKRAVSRFMESASFTPRRSPRSRSRRWRNIRFRCRTSLGTSVLSGARSTWNP